VESKRREIEDTAMREVEEETGNQLRVQKIKNITFF
jgi:8-oxo-dGTP pyrophosphatase MutT (NUDIX family)